MAKRSELIKYVRSYLDRELTEVKISPIADVASVLSMEERTLIYKYSEDGYESVNISLRKNQGKNKTEFGRLLDNVLRKLPNYRGLVFRSANLTGAELERYKEAYEKNTILVEHSFISTSKSIGIASMYGKSCQFTIISRTGKEIEEFTKYGFHSGQNEKEILFRPNRRFTVLEVTKLNNSTLILMEEVSP